MRMTVDLPAPLLERVKIAAVKRQTTMRKLMIQGLEAILDADVPSDPVVSHSALQRLQQGFALGNQPLTRDQIHGR